MIWIVTVVYNGDLELTEAYAQEEDAIKRVEELTKNYFFVAIEEIEIQ